jgi:hypothetical protein
MEQKSRNPTRRSKQNSTIFLQTKTLIALLRIMYKRKTRRTKRGRRTRRARETSQSWQPPHHSPHHPDFLLSFFFLSLSLSLSICLPELLVNKTRNGGENKNPESWDLRTRQETRRKRIQRRSTAAAADSLGPFVFWAFLWGCCLGAVEGLSVLWNVIFYLLRFRVLGGHAHEFGWRAFVVLLAT